MNREPTMADVALGAARRIGAASRDDEIAKLKAENKRLRDELEAKNNMPHDLDAIRQAIKERDAALQACDDLANQMIYRGNSVGWWYSKAVAYRDALGRSWDALKAAGIHPDGKTDVATAIRQLAGTIDAEVHRRRSS